MTLRPRTSRGVLSNSLTAMPRLCALAFACAFICVSGDSVYATSSEVQASQQDSWRGEQEKAVKLARAGHTNEALRILQKLYKEHPGDTKLAHDILAVSGWAGHDDSVVSVYEALPAGKKPDYVLGTVGLSYRNMKQPEQALEIYRQGLAQSPSNASFAVGVIRSLMDAKRFPEAEKAGQENISKYGERIDVLVATSEASLRGGDIYQALVYAEHAHDKAPGNHDAIRALVILHVKGCQNQTRLVIRVLTLLYACSGLELLLSASRPAAA